MESKLVRDLMTIGVLTFQTNVHIVDLVCFPRKRSRS
jgi:hypothetical protein